MLANDQARCRLAAALGRPHSYVPLRGSDMVLEVGERDRNGGRSGQLRRAWRSNYMAELTPDGLWPLLAEVAFMAEPMSMRLILASASPARRKLLARLGHPFLRSCPPTSKEPETVARSRTFVQTVSWLKAAAVAPRIDEGLILWPPIPSPGSTIIPSSSPPMRPTPAAFSARWPARTRSVDRRRPVASPMTSRWARKKQRAYSVRRTSAMPISTRTC